MDLGKDGRSLKVTDAAENEYPPIPYDFNTKNITERRRDLKRTLKNIKNSLGRNPTLEDAGAALDVLNRKGLSWMTQIFGGEHNKVVNVFQQSFRSWKAASDPLVITVAAELGEFIPFEFLPLFELSEWPLDCDLPTFAEAIRRFPAFSAIIRREFTIKVDQDLELHNESRLPLKYFVERSLPGAAAEAGFFEANKSHIDVDGPWPMEEVKARAFSKAMADYLRFANPKFDGENRTPIDQIQHFSCHCEIDEIVSSDSMLIFSEKNNITISDLQASYAIPDPRERPKFGPLIFLNACGTAEDNPMTVTSFPRFFIVENGNRGFIGTEINVPDSFAAEFSQCFYRGLLKGLTLGHAIHEAKWTMLRERNNPLGMLYTVYANPDLHVSNPVKVVA